MLPPVTLKRHYLVASWSNFTGDVVFVLFEAFKGLSREVKGMLMSQVIFLVMTLIILE